MPPTPGFLRIFPEMVFVSMGNIASIKMKISVEMTVVAAILSQCLSCAMRLVTVLVSQTLKWLHTDTCIPKIQVKFIAHVL